MPRRQRAAQATTIAPRWQTLWHQHGPFGGTLARTFGPWIWRGRRTPLVLFYILFIRTPCIISTNHPSPGYFYYCFSNRFYLKKEGDNCDWEAKHGVNSCENHSAPRDASPTRQGNITSLVTVTKRQEIHFRLIMCNLAFLYKDSVCLQQEHKAMTGNSGKLLESNIRQLWPLPRVSP